MEEKDRRRRPRKPLMFYSRVFHRMTGELLGYLADLTTEGANLISEDLLEVNGLYPLRMDLPERNFPKAYLSFDARCIWCQKDVNPDLFSSGFELMDLSTEDKAIIERILKEYGFRGE